MYVYECLYGVCMCIYACVKTICMNIKCEYNYAPGVATHYYSNIYNAFFLYALNLILVISHTQP